MIVISIGLSFFIGYILYTYVYKIRETSELMFPGPVCFAASLHTISS